MAIYQSEIIHRVGLINKITRNNIEVMCDVTVMSYAIVNEEVSIWTDQFIILRDIDDKIEQCRPFSYCASLRAIIICNGCINKTH